MNIVLTGFMASGKSSIGQAIAAISKYAFTDTDTMISAKAGMEINEIFSKHGEEYFRQIERDVVQEAAAADNTVIATGGGVVLDKGNMQNLRRTGVIFNLDPDFSVIEERAENARKSRPLMQDEDICDIKKRFEARKPFYDDCDFKIHVINGRTPNSYAMEILRIMEDYQK